MLADRRAEALVGNFAGQWLQLRNLRAAIPDQNDFPDFDDNLRQAFRRETELLFQSVVREDRSVLDLLTADYTFVNERLARHYGIPSVYGSHFRRVPVTDDARRGLLGHGSILLLTSHPDRTSPVLRGKWILDNLLGTPPPPPPANVPALEESAGTAPRTVREQMEIHRKNPSCASCHRMMDPLGLALENFDAVGGWRTRDAGFARGRVGRARGRHASRRRGGAAAGAARPARDVRQPLEREDADLRGRPWARLLRSAGGPRRSRGMRRGRVIGFRPSSWAWSTARRSGCGPAGTAGQFGPRRLRGATLMFVTKSIAGAENFPAGHGRGAGIAAARLDGAGADRGGPVGGQARGTGSGPSTCRTA